MSDARDIRRQWLEVHRAKLNRLNEQQIARDDMFGEMGPFAPGGWNVKPIRLENCRGLTIGDVAILPLIKDDE